MSYNILSENDLDDIPDFDGSVSSNNSDNEKVDSSLIKKILSEMKSEFSRGTSGSTTDTVEKFDSSDEAVQIDDKDDVKVDIQKLIEQNLNSIESCDEHQICDDNSSTPISEELSNNHIILNNTVFEPQETRNEEKPRIILTLRTSEEDRENCNWPEKRSNHIVCQSTSDETDEMVLSTDQRERDSILIETSSQIDLKETMSECRTRRSLRSQSMMKDENDVDKRSKRSSRRFSKENGRESVLQNAIARKEKSFNALNQSEERSYRRGARSPRHCSNESKPVRICRTKSPKAQVVNNCPKQTECDNLEINGAEVSSDKEMKVKSEYDTFVVMPSISIIDLKNSEADVKKSEVKTQVTVNPRDNPNLFTKTGKRRPRYRYFKGLKYSLTGGSVRKKALKLARKKKTVTPTPDPSPALDEHTCTEESPLILPPALDISPSPSIPSPSYISSSTPPLPTVCSPSNLLLININSPLTVNNDNVTSTCTEEVDNHVEIKHEVEESSELCSSVTETNCNEVIDTTVETKPDSIMEPRIESTLDVKCEQSPDPELSLTVADTQFSDVVSEPCPLEEQEIQLAAVDSHQSGTEEDSSTEIKNEPVEGSLTQVVGIKRKHLSDEGEEENDKGSEKRCRQDTASPSTGEGDIEPDTPESTAITYGVGSAGLCLCNSRLELYASANSFRTELYCQAVDSLDERLIGCCNTVDKENARLVRPSVRVPYLVLCDIHHQRLQRHNCCPGCGNFCTQGKFLQCSLNHHYHKDCQLTQDNKTMCPHCGSESDMNINISLGAHKYPVFLPLQKPPKTVPSAKMTIGGCKNLLPAADTEGFSSSLPLVPASALILPSGLQITAQGLPPSLDKDKLEHLLHVACNIHSQPQQRYTLRNMYQAAKNGDAEKMIYMLASGLNPNHVFREWIMGSALHAASSGGHLSVVHLLLQSGANTDVLDRDQNTPLMLACSNGHNEVVKYLVKAGASVTFKGGDGMTALHLAAKSGNLEACYYLISNPNAPRSYIDSVDDGRWTPLVWAAEHRHTDVVKFLLEKRADPLVRDAEQNIALHWAALAGSVDISEALLNYGSDINSTNAHADTPLHIAARQNVYECVLLLLARGARVDVHNRVGFLPLDCCMVNPSDTYTAIKLNVELRALMLNVQKRSQRILTNDITRGHEGNPIQCVNAVDDEAEPQDFVYIIENCFTSNINIDRTITSLQSCKCRDVCSSGSCMCGKISIRCWYDDEGKLLPEFNFADPPMLFECNQACLCNRLTCKNRVVQHGITARFQLFRTKGNKGWGVSTLRIIPKGSYVCEYIGEIISDCEADTREDDSYLFDLDNRDGETYCIDARRYGNIARFINHSCVPNLLPVRVFINHQDLHFPRIAFFANRDIEANEELGFDYGEKFWIIKYKLFTCTCAAENCRYSESTIEKTLSLYNTRLKQELDDSH